MFLERIENHSKVAAVRTMGVILAIDLDIEMERYGELRDRIFNYFMKEGIYLRPLGNTIYVLPPYVISNKQLKTIYDAIEFLLNRVL